MVAVHHLHRVGERHEHPAVTTAPQQWRQLASLPVLHAVEQARLLVLQVAGMEDELLRGVVDIGRLVFHFAEPGQQRAGHIQRVHPVLVTSGPVVEAAFGTALGSFADEIGYHLHHKPVVLPIPLLEKRKHYHAGNPTVAITRYRSNPLPTLIPMGDGCDQFEQFFSALRRVESSPFLHVVDVRNIVGSLIAFSRPMNNVASPQSYG